MLMAANYDYKIIKIIRWMAREFAWFLIWRLVSTDLIYLSIKLHLYYVLFYLKSLNCFRAIITTSMVSQKL